MRGMKVPVNFEPCLKGTVLMLLEKGDNIVQCCGEVVAHQAEGRKMFRKHLKTGASFGGVTKANASVDHPCRQQSLEVLEGRLNLRPGLNNLRAIARKWEGNTFDRFRDVTVA